MPASLYPTSNPAASLSLGSLDLIMMEQSSSSSSFDTTNTDSRAAAEQIALQLALLQQHGSHSESSQAHHAQHHHHAHNGHGGGGHHQHPVISTNNSGGLTASDMLNSLNGHGASGSLEDLKNTQRRSQNMTECVPVPSSEHVAEIVGRQGCKIKALRAKTNTYIKTPVRGEEPVFVVTGRKEDVGLAKREILSAADHFSQIRASRKSNINSTLAFGQLVANTPGQTTVQVRVPYRVVGLVVGPKGATIKRIQQQTHTYIVTPSRDKEPVFEVTGLPENVDAARKEIEAHIALRTGTSDFPGGQPNGVGGSQNGGYYNLNENGVNGDNDLFSGGLNSPFSSSSGNLDHVNSILNNDSGLGGFKPQSNGGGGASGITLQNLLDSNNFDLGGSSRSVPWSNGTDSHDSGIGNSPPFENGLGGSSSAFKSFQQTNPTVVATTTSSNSSSGHTQHNEPTLSGIWGELNKALGGLDFNGSASNNEINRQFMGMSFGNGSSNNHQRENNGGGGHQRCSLDLGTFSRNLTSSTAASEAVSTSMNNTANNMSMSIGRQLSLPSATSESKSLPLFNGILSSSASSSSNQDSEITKDDLQDTIATEINAFST